MSHESLDPRRQQMIAALYGELSPEEDQQFQEWLRSDAGLRAEWEELLGTRSFLKEWAIPDPEPRFVFVDQPDSATTAPAAPPRKRFWNRLSAFLPAPAWGFAALSLVLAGLMVAGLRVDRVPGGMVLHFGENPGQTRMLAEATPTGGPLVSLNDGPHRLGVPAAQTLTPANLDAFSADMMGSVVALLQEYQNEQNAQLAYILNGFYEELRTEGRRDYRELRTRMEGVGLSLLAEQTRTNARIKTLIDRGNTIPMSDPPQNKNEEQ